MRGELVTGATWASSDTDVVSLSTADPPVLTAVAPGTVTISVGDASAEVTVYSGPSLPLGTVVWTNGASTAGGLYPAVPNYDAVADVFAGRERRGDGDHGRRQHGVGPSGPRHRGAVSGQGLQRSRLISTSTPTPRCSPVWIKERSCTRLFTT
jgi:hypothetical protein